MPRPFNYTGRELISRSDVLVRLSQQENRHAQIEVSVDVTKYRFSQLGNAAVILEAYIGSTGERQRFKLTEPWVRMAAERFKLGEIREPEQLRFNLKVVENDGDGRLLGSCRQIRWIGFEDLIENADGLLEVEPRQIGQLLWKIEFPLEGKPVLLWSKEFWGRRDELVQNAVFRSAALPEILRQILVKGLEDSSWADDENSDVAWFDDWKNWMNSQRDLRGLLDAVDDLDDAEARERWVDEVVERFAASTRLRLGRRLAEHLSKGSG